ncbi:hypothetical protein MXB_1679 [Myxobolus squamalis]|nr:hypothetical protein MXB_1679 [Myxobolus squamalis]
MIQKNDEERFEDEPEDYVRLEIEGDAGSRRQSTADFVSALSFTYDQLIVPILLDFVGQLIVKSSEDPGSGYDSPRSS